MVLTEFRPIRGHHRREENHTADCRFFLLPAESDCAKRCQFRSVTGISSRNGTSQLEINLHTKHCELASDRDDWQFFAQQLPLIMGHLLLCNGRVHFESDPSPTASEGEGAYSLRGTDRSYLPLRGKLDG